MPEPTGKDVVDWSYFLSPSGNKWLPSAIRGLFPLEKIPGMISFLAGKPSPDTFPFAALQVTLKPTVPSDKPVTLSIDGTALAEGLQYGPTAGLNGLIDWLEILQSKRHHRANDGSWRVSVGSGSQDLINKAFQALMEKDDSILLETPMYAGVLGLLIPHPVNLVEVPVDTKGLDPAKLEEILSTWSVKRPNERFPKILYTIPTGSNPTGCSSPLSRKVEVLAIARKYNLLILEDDAYHYLFFEDPQQQPPSYFELEAANGGTVGRVVRFDSFSKIMSSGMRLGFMTAAKPLVDAVDLHTANTNLQASSTTQAIALALLEHWGYEGFIAHTRRVAAFYKSKRDMFERIAHKHLDGLASWVSPDAGMFLYLDLHLSDDPNHPGDSNELMSSTAVKKGVLSVPGVAFMPSKSVSSSVRVSFSLADEETTEEAFRRLAEVITEAKQTDTKH